MRIGLVIIGRIKSTRLKNKMLLPINGQTFLEQVIDEAKKAYTEGPIIFATSGRREDAKLAKLAARKGLPVTRGSETDVLARYLQAALENKLDAVITWDGDDLFVDRQCILKTRQLLRQSFDYVKPRELPYGTFSYGMGVSALKKVIKLKADDKTEAGGRYFTQTPGFKVAEYQIKKYAPLTWLRLTLDYPEDYRLIKRVFRFRHQQARAKNSLEAIRMFARKFPKACLVNQNRVDEYEKRFRRKYSKITLKNRKNL